MAIVRQPFADVGHLKALGLCHARPKDRPPLTKTHKIPRQPTAVTRQSLAVACLYRFLTVSERRGHRAKVCPGEGGGAGIAGPCSPCAPLGRDAIARPHATKMQRTCNASIRGARDPDLLTRRATCATSS